MVRIIGRIDLAEEVRRALGAAGIDSYVVTGGPMSAAESTGTDGSNVDVLVYDTPDIEMCGSIKRIARHRPVVMVTPSKHERAVLASMRYASGPDAHVVWPASGDDLRASIDRAAAAAGTVRPPRPLGAVTLALAIALVLSGMVLRFRDMRALAEAVNAVGTLFLGAHWWAQATFTSAPAVYRFIAGLFLLGAVGQAGVVILLVVR